MSIFPARSTEQQPTRTVFITPPIPISNKGNDTASPPIEEVFPGSEASLAMATRISQTSRVVGSLTEFLSLLGEQENVLVPAENRETRKAAPTDVQAKVFQQVNRLRFQVRQIRGMALDFVENDDEKMKAETPTLRQTLIHELVQEFSMHLRSLGSNDRRGTGFRWITQSLQSLKDTVLLDPAWKRRVQRSYKLLIDKLSAYPEGLKLSREPATIDLLVIMFVSHEKLSRLEDAPHARLGEAALNTPANGRLHTDVAIPASDLCIIGGCSSTEHEHAAAHTNKGTTATVASIATPYPASPLGGTPISPRPPFRLYLPLLI
ncbi:hypothetical protein EDB83DRAFT_2520050 [Lactarius deliciosus]|nr:hypothetical protein EDB83DRAFT_2520050 [Lactarius deliciosus]